MTYLYSNKRRHIAASGDSGGHRRLSLCGAQHDTILGMVAGFRRFLTGDLVLQRRIEKARKMPVCSWCSRRAAALPREEAQP